MSAYTEGCACPYCHYRNAPELRDPQWTRCLFLEEVEPLVPQLRVVPKPVGFELRDKRSEKANDASRWTPADAIYDASQRIAGREVTQLVVYWWEKDSTMGGREVLKWANATTGIAEHGWLLQKALNALVDQPAH